MARKAHNGRVNVYPTGWIEVSGTMENGHVLEISLSPEEAQVIADTFKIEAQMEDGHLGHAHWHVRNPESEFPCSTCGLKEVK